MNALRSLAAGWRRAASLWPVLLPLYLVSLASGILASALPILQLLGPAHSTAVRDAAAGIPAWLLGEIILSPLNNLSLASTSNGRVLSQETLTLVIGVWISVVLLPILAWLPGSLVSGGAMLRLWDASTVLAAGERRGAVAEKSTEPASGFNLSRFAWGCWHFWGTYLVWGVLQTFFTVIVLALCILPFILAISINLWAGLILGTLALLLIGLWTAYAELVQVGLASGRKGGYGRALRGAWNGLRRQPWSLMGFYALSLGLLLVLHLVFQGLLFPRMPLVVWPLVLFLQQVFIVLRITARLARLAGDIEYLPVPAQGTAVSNST